MHGALEAMPDPGIMVDESYVIHLNMLLFELKGKAKDYVEQLKIFETMLQQHSIPGFTAQHFFKRGLEASESREPGMDMCLTLAS